MYYQVVAGIQEYQYLYNMYKKIHITHVLTCTIIHDRIVPHIGAMT